MTKRVLLVDDNPDNRVLLFYALETGDFEIHQAETATEAYTLLATGGFDLTLLDVALPDGNGLDIAACVRQQYPKAVIIIFSALDNPSELTRGAEAGVNAYVIKPFSLPYVLALIESIDAQTFTADSKMKIVKS
jgi:DNA-binding response OmpR family regulator